MNSSHDPNIRIGWFLILNDNSRMYERVAENGQPSNWRTMINFFTEDLYPIGIGLSRVDGKEVVLECVSDSFLFLKKAVLLLGSPESNNLLGLGYGNKDRSKVSITWFDEALDPQQLEERDFEKCREIMIIKNTTAYSSQS